MTHRLGVTEWAEPSKRIRPRGALVLRPVERRFPATFPHCRPPVGQPELGTLVTAVGDERPVFAIRYEPVRDPTGPNQLVVTRILVVEGEPRAGISDGVDSRRRLDPALGRDCATRCASGYLAVHGT